MLSNGRTVPTQKGRSPYVRIRFVPFEKVSKHYKLMLAFDAFVLWKVSGQMPTKGKDHSRFATSPFLNLRLDTLIHEVQPSRREGSVHCSARAIAPDPVLIKHCPNSVRSKHIAGRELPTRMTLGSQEVLACLW